MGYHAGLFRCVTTSRCLGAVLVTCFGNSSSIQLGSRRTILSQCVRKGSRAFLIVKPSLSQAVTQLHAHEPLCNLHSLDGPLRPREDVAALSDPCVTSAGINLTHRVHDCQTSIHVCSNNKMLSKNQYFWCPEHLEELQVETDDSVAAIVQTLAAAGDSGKNSVIDPRLAAGLQQSWHRWSCEFPGHMNHNNIRKRIEDVVTSQQNELLNVQFRREECKD